MTSPLITNFITEKDDFIAKVANKKDEDYVESFNSYFISDSFKRIYHSQFDNNNATEETLFNEEQTAVFKDFLINEYSEIISKKLQIVQSLFLPKSANSTTDLIA